MENVEVRLNYANFPNFRNSMKGYCFIDTNIRTMQEQKFEVGSTIPLQPGRMGLWNLDIFRFNNKTLGLGQPPPPHSTTTGHLELWDSNPYVSRCEGMSCIFGLVMRWDHPESQFGAPR